MKKLIFSLLLITALTTPASLFAMLTNDQELTDLHKKVTPSKKVRPQAPLPKLEQPSKKDEVTLVKVLSYKNSTKMESTF